MRLVFLGRPTAWKGVSSILELALVPVLANTKLLFFFPYEHADLFKNIPVELTERISVVVSKSFRDYKPSYGDVHLYPANYGTSAKFIESISINCLEMASVGIPSFITRGGLLTWPEFLSNPLFVEVDWFDTFGTARKINDLYKTKVSDFELSEIKRAISVSNYANQLQDFMI
jgi:hypothetical protein